ncbi:MAG TPA: biotin/lipoyl-containing protein [Anaerolineales bacterium]|nr:biotin/lipoyl-containing protein [Anaerolineales bacterium]
MKVVFDQSTLELSPDGKDYRAALGDITVDVEIVGAANGKFDLRIDHKQVTAYVSSDGAKRWVTVHGQTFVLTKSSNTKQRSSAGDEHMSELAAPMPGQVRSVNAKEGDSVSKGQTLLVLEAMKMEIRIQAPFDGVLKELLVKVGQTVEREQILVKLDHG